MLTIQNVEFNLETNILCKKVIPVGIDDSMIGKAKVFVESKPTKS
jgi:hypothetical protein